MAATSSIINPSASSYAESGFSHRMGWGTRSALLLVDVCTAYFTEGSPLSLLSNPEAVAAPDSMRRLLAAARKGRVPVLWSKIEYLSPDMADAGLWWRKAKLLDVWRQGDLRGLDRDLDGLSPSEGDVVVVKKFASAFFGTRLAEELQRLHVDTLVICGVSTSGCVRATALDAMQSGFRPMVVGSACGDRTPEIQNANLFDLDAKYADVVDEADAVSHLEAGWP